MRNSRNSGRPSPLRSAGIVLVVLLTLPLAAPHAATFTGGTVAAPDGVAIAYESGGAGSPALVFVHGWSCDRSYWREQMEHFAAEHRVVALDLAGHGDSGTGREVHSMAAFGGDVAAVLAALDIEQAVIVGHSMGGAVMVEAALAAPERVVGLVGVDNFQDLEMEIAPEAIDGFLGAIASDFPARVDAWVRTMFPAGADTALVDAVAGDMAAAPPAVALDAMRELLNWYGGGEARARLALLRAPLVCINADAQPTDADAMRAVVPGYGLHVMPGHGHFLMREDPAGFDALLTEVLDEIARR